MTHHSPTVAEKLKALRERSGYSVREMAERLGRPKSTYEAYESTYKRPYLPPDLVEQLVTVLDGRGEPPIERAEVLALAGLQSVGIINQLKNVDKPPPGRTIGISELDVRANAGGGAILEGPVKERELARWEIFRDVIRGQTTAPVSALRIITVFGDSMEPDFQPGQRVLRRATPGHPCSQPVLQR